jgi:DNA-binding NarL/FixJ family response regulator
MPEVQVLVLTAYDDDQYIFSLLQAGASGYLLKTAPVNELVKAIRLVKSGESPLDPSIARKVVIRMAGDQGSRIPVGEDGTTDRSTDLSRAGGVAVVVPRIK